MPETDRSFYLDKAELALLLHQRSVSRLYCLDLFGNNVTIDDSAACEGLFSLVGEELITTDGDAFAVAEELDDCMAVITGCRRIIGVYSHNPSQSSLAVYCGDKDAVVLQQAENRTKAVKLTWLAAEEVSAYLLQHTENRCDLQSASRSSPLFYESLALLMLHDSFSAVTESEYIRCFMEWIDPKAQTVVKRLAVCSHEEALSLCVWNEKGYLTVPYSRDALQQQMERQE